MFIYFQIILCTFNIYPDLIRDYSMAGSDFLESNHLIYLNHNIYIYILNAQEINNTEVMIIYRFTENHDCTKIQTSLSFSWKKTNSVHFLCNTEKK